MLFTTTSAPTEIMFASFLIITSPHDTRTTGASRLTLTGRARNQFASFTLLMGATGSTNFVLTVSASTQHKMCMTHPTNTSLLQWEALHGRPLVRAQSF